MTVQISTVSNELWIPSVFCIAPICIDNFKSKTNVNDPLKSSTFSNDISGLTITVRISYMSITTMVSTPLRLLIPPTTTKIMMLMIIG